MADFYPVLARAVSALAENTPEARRSIYERARAALVAQMRSIQPPLPEERIAAQVAALDDAAQRIERDHAPQTAAVPASVPMPAPVAPPVVQPAPQPVQPPPVARPPVESRVVPEAEPASKPAVPVEPARAELARAEPVATVPEASEPDAAAPEMSEPAIAEPSLPPRPRIAPPARATDPAGRRRTLIVGGGVAAAVAAIAVAAYVVNSGPPRPVVQTTAPSIAPRQEASGKVGDRVGADQPASAQPQAQQALPVAQRAVLYIETPDNPQQPKTVGGRVAWRLDSESTGPGRPVETVVRATVEWPEIGLALNFTIRRNMDAAFPASHIIGLRFTRSSDDGNGVVKEAGVPQFKAEEGERGAPLSAITSALGDNLFVSALSNVPIERERNLDLLSRRNWIDIPVRFNSGARAIIAFEKGFSGDQTITDALNRWR